MTITQFDQCIAWMRHQLRGQSFAANPEGFKDLESLKAKKYAAFPDSRPTRH